MFCFSGLGAALSGLAKSIYYVFKYGYLWSLTDELQLLNKKREVLEDKLRGNKILIFYIIESYGEIVLSEIQMLWLVLLWSEFGVSCVLFLRESWRVPYSKLLSIIPTACSSYTEKYWPLVVFVSTLLHLVCTATTEANYFLCDFCFPSFELMKTICVPNMSFVPLLCKE